MRDYVAFLEIEVEKDKHLKGTLELKDRLIDQLKLNYEKEEKELKKSVDNMKLKLNEVNEELN